MDKINSPAALTNNYQTECLSLQDMAIAGVNLEIAKAMEDYFGGDKKRITHALRVTMYATKLLKSEKADHDVVIAAALLHDIGIHEAEKNYGSTIGKYQEIEGPPIARPILERIGFTPDQIEEICQIIAHHHSPGKIKTQNFKVLYDADWLINLKDEYNIKDKKKLANIINKVLLTQSGKALAKQIYINNHC